ncbi:MULTISPECIES: bifunctional UDP-N-acetylmuramoyl-L-alanyl-D-glutamate--2,6-diaminopimelate ligase MurE/UDP-N-acetylmuramoyl-tripeptide--D-alanyl-D-alanine ligase MurF [unclassified Achromobacter]|uniref:bifunctional UDP-N-acetylmuramoyl-L-alanyl-D-glutamate--2, 6-diaminopimelate ligase MurE/UDP-N-acetylmuramoyl-tripeptide--D-alanyl-D-alanine ligase MurF n=1 Tax=unclassified Achromobacter TaxID=2626865 RepID=UPI000B51C16A|nr:MULTISPECIES: bifunctional UDP-N-acetylmuramoyl-L-alanyl-D-glutamate--2,6-diaminopimelate ligase MurE/UDP-N-acetylmuramoyl-tripeptide--D-alanyl-D-alanine ligase MurF [unclassified Achromobacter]OWT72667.1 UDP-N-acetylmuramoyl-L-alanyl-D-glutamate--2,6-diaminopimelate ligase [Achromobacter sp. HZ34]OWT73884.1 UDP-N-acetylmuramoyl-L-alanyl-D-glutamate--2,6-diaminopimelate ligase [Achromobacter sp. HZ28]
MNALADTHDNRLPAADIVHWLRARAPGQVRSENGPQAHLRLDSREVAPGDVFVACPGGTSDGRLYIEQAIQQGAAAVVYEAAGYDAARAAAVTAIAGSVPVLPVAELRGQLGRMADIWYGEPSAALTVIAVTGTNGKTSTVQWLARALSHSGRPCGALGTLGATLPDGQALPGQLTTPDVLAVHRQLATMRDHGASCVAMEASSIGIEQGRLDGVRIGVAAFTNLTRDHLDYHGSMDAYEAAKSRLFDWPGLVRAVINAGDAAGQRLLARLPAGLALAYSLEGQAAEDAHTRVETRAEIRATGLSATAHGQIFTLATAQGEAQIMTGLLGRHNVENLLLVAGVLTALGGSLADVARELAAATPVPGRMEVVAAPQALAAPGPLVVVDYSHTPDALARALAALRPVAQARGGRLLCLFGCGGDRDPGKRPLMGGIAAADADGVYVTSDNPRSEAPDAIIDQILAGMPAARAVTVQADRARAIMQAVWSAAVEDVLLLAGKGHESYQEIAGQRLPFDDRAWGALALSLPQAVGVSTDTRTLSEGQVFVALSGENFDGHDYLAQAHQAGARAAVVAHAVDGAPLDQWVVGDTRAALCRIGAAWRARFDLPVIGVTGSNGKTTTKEMIAAILAQWLGADQRLATAGNYNNDIGVPLTLLRLRPQHRAAVIELGMNHPGEIAALTAMAAPTVGLVNNAQREHQEFMHSVEAVARENGAVLATLPESGYAVYPGDDAHTGVWDEMAATPRVLRFGLQAGLDVYAEAIECDVLSTRCRLVTPAGTAELTLPVPGLHNLRNALAAVACGLAAGAPLDAACRALADFSAVKGRMQRQQMGDGTVLVDDTYNANPDSVRAAIDVLAQLPAPRVLVLGDMGEVGANGPAMHQEVGAYARERGIDALFTLGTAAQASAAAFGPAGTACDSVEDIVTATRAMRPAAVLVKGSRFMRMERVVKLYSSEGSQVPTAQEGKHAA